MRLEQLFVVRQAGAERVEVNHREQHGGEDRGLKRPGVLIVDPAGTEVGYIPTGPSQPGAKVPTGLPSNVAFGLGTDATTLYVTVDVSLYRVKGLAVPGYHIPFEVG